MIFIIPPNFYVVDEAASPPTQLEPFYHFADVPIFHLKRGMLFDDIPEADFYGISAYTEDYPVSLLIARYLKARHPSCTIVIGGSHATIRPDDIDEIFDYVVVGPGEGFIQRLFNDKLCSRIMRFGTRIIRWPQLSYKYFADYVPGLHRGTSSTYPIRTSTGCYSNCKFCIPHKHVKFRSVADIANQLLFLESKGIKCLRVMDDIFTCHPEFELLSSMFSRFKWSAVDRIDALNPHKASVLRNNGCFLVQVGIESFDETIRAKLGKRLSDKTLYKHLAITKDVGLQIQAFIMLGTPWDTFDSIKRTRDTGLSLMGRDGVRPDIFCALPGTTIGDNLNNLRAVETNYVYYSVFPFQNVHGRLTCVPLHITNISKWEQLLRDVLYEMSSDLVRDCLDSPVKRWITDYEDTG